MNHGRRKTEGKKKILRFLFNIYIFLFIMLSVAIFPSYYVLSIQKKEKEKGMLTPSYSLTY